MFCAFLFLVLVHSILAFMLKLDPENPRNWELGMFPEFSTFKNKGLYAKSVQTPVRSNPGSL
jgi:hypothetical protein